jgi:hypothetical protein
VNIANLSVFKSFSLAAIREGMRLEYRAEAFNALNHAQFSSPDTTVNGGTFGQIFSTTSPARQVQMALKFYF